MVYPYRCIKCEHQFDLFIKTATKAAELKPIGEVDASVVCEKCGHGGCKRTLASFFATTSTAEPWEYDYTHKAKPKFVRDSKGQRHKFNPSIHMKGRKGSG